MRHFFYGLLFICFISFPTVVSAEKYLIAPHESLQSFQNHPYQSETYLSPYTFFTNEHDENPYSIETDNNLTQMPDTNYIPSAPEPTPEGELNFEPVPDSNGKDEPKTDKDCKDFSSQPEAQKYFDENGGSKTNNFDNLDGDHDGIACESLKSEAEPKQDEKQENEQSQNKPDAISEEKIQALLNDIKKRVGKSDGGWDCSAFVQAMYRQHLDVNLPRVTDRQYLDRLKTKEQIEKLKKGTVYSKKISSKQNLKPGDIVFFKDTYNCVGQGHCTTGKNISHVGIYIGNGKFIDGSISATTIREKNLNDSYWQSRWYGGKRYYIKQ